MMRSFVFLAIAVAAFIVIIFGRRLITENTFEWPGTASSAVEEGELALNADALAQCLSTRGAMVFGAAWCPACRHQDELFGSAASFLQHVDCDENPTACADAGVRSIPAWEIGGQLMTGVQSLDRLADLADCRGQSSVQKAGQMMPELPELEAWEVSEISYSWRDATGGFHVTTEAPPKGALEVEIFR